MKTKNILLLISIVVVLVSLFYSFWGNQDQTTYINKIKKEREEKDHFMKTSDESPFRKKRDEFSALKYYPVNPQFKIVADLTPVKDKNVMVLATSDGKEERYIEYAYAEFDFNGLHNKLLILEMMEMGPSKGKLFLAFGDETSGDETYGAGRYIDVAKVMGSQTITLDFNNAYNPYCAYADEFSCPFPPAENLLKIAVTAGEKTYH
ncbi:MAG TPA: DUF1684 domain-containing protein [Chryseolinea sp.]|nr:DUF1684 domain-containing protein [Chryseolinea sp.]HPH46764.1 DUF1684 domain-containing protein [Chryseolinea sp.]HPM32123.1 DUF1684 domain-containing protein [Chryseolinea sp.]